MDQIHKVSMALHDVAIRNTNTKVEIKSGVKELKRKLETINVMMDEFQENQTESHKNKTRRTDSSDPPKKVMKSIETQVYPKTIEEDRKTTKLKEEQRCEEQLEKRRMERSKRHF